MENNEQGKSKLIMGLVCLFLLIGVGGGGYWWYLSTKYVSTDDARIGGTIVSVSAKIPGRIIEVLVKEGEQVNQEDLLISFEIDE